VISFDENRENCDDHYKVLKDISQKNFSQKEIFLKTNFKLREIKR